MRRIAVGVVSVALLAVAAGCAGGLATRVEESEADIAELGANVADLAMLKADVDSMKAEMIAESEKKVELQRQVALQRQQEDLARLQAAVEARRRREDIAARQAAVKRLREDCEKLSRALEAVQADVKELQYRMQEPAASPTLQVLD